MKQKDYNGITSLRFFFIMIIVLFHVGNAFNQPISIFAWIYKFGGYLGNYFFFIISGFLTLNSFYNSPEKYTVNILEYIFYKVKKIYPLYLISNLFVLLFNIIKFGASGQIVLSDLLQNILMISSGWINDNYPYNSPTWFMSTLLFCYVIFYVVIQIKRKSEKLYFLCVLSLIFYGFFLMNQGLSFPFMYTHNGEGLFNFFCGVLLFELYSKYNTYCKYFIYVGIPLVALIILLASKYGFKEICGDLRPIITLIIIPTIVLSTVFIKPIIKILNIKILYLAGKLSMSIWVWHIPAKLMLDEYLSKYLNSISLKNKWQLLIYISLVLIWSAISTLLLHAYKVAKKYK